MNFKTYIVYQPSDNYIIHYAVKNSKLKQFDMNCPDRLYFIACVWKQIFLLLNSFLKIAVFWKIQVYFKVQSLSGMQVIEIVSFRKESAKRLLQKWGCIINTSIPFHYTWNQFTIYRNKSLWCFYFWYSFFSENRIDFFATKL